MTSTNETIDKIIFFNHFHNGDLHTNKEFVRQIKSELNSLDFQYCTTNPQKLLNELNITVSDIKDLFFLDKHKPIFKKKSVLYINTWVGCFWSIFCDNGGTNMFTLYKTWGVIFDAINKILGTSLALKPKLEDYLPKINYKELHTKDIDNFLEARKNKFKVLICNNVPRSGQSFVSDMADIINKIAIENKNVDFYCTDKFESTENNIFFTDDITKFVDSCDLLEISYLSTKVDVIVGKNSGPFVFCETYDNYMDPSKTFISFNKNPQEYMCKNLKIKSKFKTVGVKHLENISQTEIDLIYNTIKEALPYEKT